MAPTPQPPLAPHSLQDYVSLAIEEHGTEATLQAIADYYREASKTVGGSCYLPYKKLSAKVDQLISDWQEQFNG
jgi:hypothetical protein